MAGNSKSVKKGWASMTLEARQIRIQKFRRNRHHFSSEELSRRAKMLWERPGFRENQIRKHRDKKPSLATRKKMSASRKGKLRPHTGVAISIGRKKAWARLTLEERRAYLRPVHEAQRLFRPSSLERRLWKALDKFGIPYSTQKREGKYSVDIFVEFGGLRLAIECDGTYWHSSDSAKKHDFQRDLYLRAKGYSVVRIKEPWIVSDSDDVVRFLFFDNAA